MAEENYWSPEAIQARVDAYNSQSHGAQAQAPVNQAATSQTAPTNDFIEMTNNMPGVARYNAQFDTPADQRAYLSPNEVVQVTNAQAAGLAAQREQAMEGNIMDLFTSQQNATPFDSSNALTIAKSMGVSPEDIAFQGGAITDPTRVVGSNYTPTNVEAAGALPGSLPAQAPVAAGSPVDAGTNNMQQMPADSLAAMFGKQFAGGQMPGQMPGADQAMANAAQGGKQRGGKNAGQGA